MISTSSQAAVAAALSARTSAGADVDACLSLVGERFDDGQLEAALWLHDVHGMALDLANLRNMLDYWPEVRQVGLTLGAQRACGHSGMALVVADRPLGAQEFNPMQLIEYFASGPGM